MPDSDEKLDKPKCLRGRPRGSHIYDIEPIPDTAANVARAVMAPIGDVTVRD